MGFAGISKENILDFLEVAAPGNPPVGELRLYADAATGKLTAIDSDGNPAYPSGGGSGTVTSVAMTGDGVIFNATTPGSPVTTSGTLAPALLTHAKNTFLAGPSTGADATPTFRVLAIADIPATGTPGATNFLRGDGTWSIPAATAAAGSDTDLQFNDGGTDFGGATNFLYNKTTGQITANQKANTNETIYGKRFTDTTPTGNMLRFRNAANSADLLAITVDGNMLGPASPPANKWAFTAPSGLIWLDSTDLIISHFTSAKFTSGKLVQYGGIVTVSNGIPTEYATVDLTGQVAAITTTTLYTPTATGMFRISVYAKVTTASAGGTSSLGGTTGLTIGYTDGTDSVAQTLVALLGSEIGATAIANAGNTTATKLQGSAIIFAKTGVAITYAFDYVTTVGTMAYELHLKCEAL